MMLTGKDGKSKRTAVLSVWTAAMILVLSLAGCTQTAAPAASDTRIFTDSVGREVELPAQIERVALSGPMAQIVVFSLAPDKLVGIASEWDKTAEEYLDTAYYQLPVIGQLYGGKGELNLEELLRVDP